MIRKASKKMLLKKSYYRKRVFGLPNPVWILIRCLAVLCGVFMTLTATLRGTMTEGMVGVALSLIIYIWLVFRMRILENIVIAFSPLCGLSALAYAIAAARIFMAYFYFRFEKLAAIAVPFIADQSGFTAESLNAGLPLLKTTLTFVIGVALWIAAYLFFNWLRRHILPVIRSFSGMEIAFWAASVLIAAGLIFHVYKYTDLFFSPSVEGQVVLYDAVYTTDTGILMQTDAFVNINAAENDLRHPLFGLFAMPFGITASWIAFAFAGEPAAYALAIAFLQAVALFFSIILLSRLLDLRGMDQLFFLLLYIITYPVLLFTLTIEQYAFALFWTALYIYAACRGGPDQEAWRRISFSGAAGSLLTGGFFGLFAWQKGGFAHNLKMLFWTGLTFLAFLIAFGQFPILPGAAESVKKLSRFADVAAPLQVKVWQFLAFIHHCLFAPAAGPSGKYLHASYQLTAVPGPDRIGCLLLVLAFWGILLNLKSKYCRLCFCWMLFSFFLLGVAGWGSGENGMILYTLYFSWALLSLIYQGFYSLLEDHPIVRSCAAASAFLVMAAVNIRALRDLILFGTAFYPR